MPFFSLSLSLYVHASAFSESNTLIVIFFSFPLRSSRAWLQGFRTVGIPFNMSAGDPYPLGLSITPRFDSGSAGRGPVAEDLNFAVASSASGGMSLCLYGVSTSSNAAKPIMELALDPSVNLTGTVWHVRIPMPSGVDEFLWGWRSCPPDDINWTGGRVLEDAILLDPYAVRVMQPSLESKSALPNALRDSSKNGTVKFNLADGSTSFGLGHYKRSSAEFDWADDAKPWIPIEKTVLYEIDVRLFTGDDSSTLMKDERGTIGGVLAKVEYLSDLGVSTIILGPVMAGIESDRGPMSYFAISQRLGANGTSEGAATELKSLVRECHRRNIEVLIDFPITRTFDGMDGDSRCSSWRGLDPTRYYAQDESGTIQSASLDWRSLAVQVQAVISIPYVVLIHTVRLMMYINACRDSLKKYEKGLSHLVYALLVQSDC